jgi:hypothetical protein
VLEQMSSKERFVYNTRKLKLKLELKLKLVNRKFRMLPSLGIASGAFFTPLLGIIAFPSLQTTRKNKYPERRKACPIKQRKRLLFVFLLRQDSAAPLS